MHIVTRLVASALALSISIASAEPVRWTSYRISETGASADIPASIFTKRAGKPDAYGQRFQSFDGSAELTVQSVLNEAGDSPASFLEKKHPPSHIVYKRITSRFFAASSFKGDRIWYDRCNFSVRFIHCVLINYPASQKQQWDSIVTRISNTLTAG
jgi:hypothetical protein